MTEIIREPRDDPWQNQPRMNKVLKIAQSIIAEQKIMLTYTEVPRIRQPVDNQQRARAFNAFRKETSGKAQGAA